MSRILSLSWKVLTYSFNLVVAVQALFQAWPSRLQYFDGFSRLYVLHCQGCFALWATAPGQSSTNKLVALPLQDTSGLFCTGGLLAGSLTSHSDRRPIAEENIRSILVPRNFTGTTATVEHACDDNVGQVCDTCFGERQIGKAVWSRRLRKQAYLKMSSFTPYKNLAIFGHPYFLDVFTP